MKKEEKEEVKEEKVEKKEEEKVEKEEQEEKVEKKETKKSKRVWEREIREKINDNRHLSKYLEDIDAMDEQSWSMKGLLNKMTAVLDISRDEKNSHLRSVIILAAMYIIGLIFILSDSSSIWGYILVGAASFWKFFSWGSEVDDYNDKMGNVSYSARTDIFGQVKVEKNSGNVGCIMGIIGLVLGIVVTPILAILSLLKFIKANKAYAFSSEMVAELEKELKVRFTWNKKRMKWEEEVL